MYRYQGGSVVKNPPANAGETGHSLRVRKIPWRRKREPTPVFLPGESEEAGGLQSRVTKSWTRLKGLSMHAYIYILLLASQFHFDKVSLY